MECYYDAIDTLKGMISHPSVSREEKEVADFLEQTWSKAGYKMLRSGNNLWTSAPDFIPEMLLNSALSV